MKIDIQDLVAVLRDARESSGLSTVAVAATMRVEPARVEEIEQWDFTIPGEWGAAWQDVAVVRIEEISAYARALGFNFTLVDDAAEWR